MTRESSSELMGIERGKKGSNFREVLNDSLNILFKDALRVTFTNPSQAYFFLRAVWWLKKAARVRSNWEKQGVHIPLIMIFRVTNRCNLRCKDCYHHALRPSPQAEMSEDKLRSTIAETRERGICFVVIGGGEPLVRREIVDITKGFREIIFLLFTNGLLINEEIS